MSGPTRSGPMAAWSSLDRRLDARSARQTSEARARKQAIPQAPRSRPRRYGRTVTIGAEPAKLKRTYPNTDPVRQRQRDPYGHVGIVLTVAGRQQPQHALAERWGAPQQDFVDPPAHAVAEADALVSEVVRERADPDAKDFESGRRPPCRQPSLIASSTVPDRGALSRRARDLDPAPRGGDARDGASASGDGPSPRALRRTLGSRGSRAGPQHHHREDDVMDRPDGSLSTRDLAGTAPEALAESATPPRAGRAVRA